MNKESNKNQTLRSRFRMSAELLTALAYLLIVIAIWWADDFTKFTRQENIIITIALGFLDILIILLIHQFRRDAEIRAAMQKTGIIPENHVIQKGYLRKINKLTLKVFDEKKEFDSRLLQTMASDDKYLVDRGEWYLETTRFCRSMHGLKGEIMAISRFNILDFLNDDNAKKYLSENAEAIKNGISVRRIFILDGEMINLRDYRRVLEDHDKKLKSTENSGSKRSGVKWILLRHAGDDKGQDFALFYPFVVMRQRPGGRQLEVCQQELEIKDASEAFDRLWSNPNAKNVTQLPPIPDFKE